MQRIFPLLIFISVIALSSCSGRGRLILTQPDDSTSVSDGVKQAILSRLRASRLPLTIRAKLDTEIQSGAGKDSFVQVLTFKDPQLFRLEAFATGANALIFIATSDGYQFKAVLPTDKKVLIGSPSPRSLSSLIQLPLTPIEMVSLVTGRVASEFLDGNEQKIFKSKDGSIFYSAVSKSQRELRVKFDNEANLKILELSLSDQGSGALRAKLNYQVGILKYLTVSLPEIEAKVKVEELKSNVEISSDRIFVVTQPAGYVVERFD